MKNNFKYQVIYRYFYGVNNYGVFIYSPCKVKYFKTDKGLINFIGSNNDKIFHFDITDMTNLKRW